MRRAANATSRGRSMRSRARTPWTRSRPRRSFRGVETTRHSTNDIDGDRRTEGMMARTKGKKTVVEATPKEEPSRAKGGGATHGKISKGDIVWIDYEGWIVSPNGTR